MAQVFISYSRKDKDFVRKLGDALAAQKREAWVDWKDIPLTAEWQQEIFTNIEVADNFIFIISPDSVASPNCKKEIDHAVVNNKRMVPLYYRAVPDEAVPEALGRYQRLAFDDDSLFDPKFEALLKALDTDLPWTQSHTRLLIRAREWERERNENSFLLRGKDLREAEQWMSRSADREPKPTTLQSQYILASRQSATRIQRIIIAAVAVAFLIAVALAVYAFLKKKDADTNAAEATRQKGVAQQKQKDAEDATVRENVARKDAEASATEAKRQEGIAKEETAKAILEAKITNARRLATESLYRFGYTGKDLAISGALALESLEAYPTTDGVKALYQVLRLIPAAPRIIPDAHLNQQGALAFSRDGRWMASGGHENGQVILWDVSNNMKRRVLEGQLSYNYYSPAGAMAFSPDGRWLAAGCARGGSDGALCIWDTATGKPLDHPIRHAYIVRSIAFSPNGQYLATSTYGEGAGHGARLFRTTSSPWEPVEPFPSGEGPFVSVLFGDDGALAVADKSGIWITQPTSPSTGDAMRFTDSGSCYALGITIRTSAVTALCQKGIATATLKDQKYEFEAAQIRFSDIRSVEGLRMSASPDGEFVVVGDIVYSIHDSSPSLVLAARGHSLGAVAYHPDGRVVAGGLEDGSIALWPTTLGNASIPVTGSTGVVTGVSVSPDERLLATVSQDGTLRLYDISDAARIRPGPQQKVGSDVKAVSFSPDGRFLVLAAENRVRLLHPDTLKPIVDLGVSGQVVSAFTRDNHILLLLDVRRSPSLRRCHRPRTSACNERKIHRLQFESRREATRHLVEIQRRRTTPLHRSSASLEHDHRDAGRLGRDGPSGIRRTRERAAAGWVTTLGERLGLLAVADRKPLA